MKRDIERAQIMACAYFAGKENRLMVIRLAINAVRKSETETRRRERRGALEIRGEAAMNEYVALASYQGRLLALTREGKLVEIVIDDQHADVKFIRILGFLPRDRD